MADTPRVVALCGSLKDESYTRIACQHALDAAERAGGDRELIDLRALDMPVFDPDAEETADVRRMTATIREADSIILGTPMYHGSYASPLKTALDYCGFDEFENKTVGLLAVAGGSFPTPALDHLRLVCRAVNAWVLPHQAAVPRSHSAFEGGEFVDDSLAKRVETLGKRTVEYSSIEPDPPSFESEENVGAD